MPWRKSCLGFIQRQTVDLSDAITTRDTLISQLEAIRKQHEAAQQELLTVTVALEATRADNETAKQRMHGREAQIQAEAAKDREALQKEREVVQRLAANAQMAKMSEEGLRAAS